MPPIWAEVGAMMGRARRKSCPEQELSNLEEPSNKKRAAIFFPYKNSPPELEKFR